MIVQRQSAQTEIVVEVENLSVSLGGRDVLKNVSLNVTRGSLVGIVGPNGGGKTTLLRAILGFVQPSGGSVRLLGMPPREALRSGWRVGYLPQGAHPDAEFPASALDVAMMGRFGRVGLFRRPGSADTEAARRALALVGMHDLANRPFGRLSGGQQQRVSIARALSGEPEILILDEPSTGVDMVAQEDFYDILRDLQNRLGLSIVMSTHDVGMVSSVVDEIACLSCTLSYHGAASGLEDGGILEKTYGPRMEMLVHGEDCGGCRGDSGA